MSALLQAEELRVRRGGVEILRGVDLTVAEGEIFAVVGPNGAGKSTLLAACAGLLPAHGGRVHRQGRVSTVLQAPALANRSAQANVEVALKWSGRRGRRIDRAARARAALDLLGAAHLAPRHAATLSGGEARRVHLARGLVTEPDILLLDEPFAGLDPLTRADLLFDAASALRSEGRATVIVVHDRGEAWALADRVGVLLDGRIAAAGTPAEVFNRPPSEAVAAFVGFSGRLLTDTGVLRLRPSDVSLGENGTHEGTVSRLVPIEDGVQVLLTCPTGSVVATAAAPGPSIGSTVRFSLTGGLGFGPADDQSSDPTPTRSAP
jgi:ABC-type sugar transport system ATPase subunit